jgi:hypothetical protein
MHRRASSTLKPWILNRFLPGLFLIGAVCVAPSFSISQDRPLPNRAPSRAQPDAQQDEFEDIQVNVPNMAVAGKLLREVAIAKAQSQIPPGDATPRFDAENNRLYFRTSTVNVEKMKSILASLQAGAEATIAESSLGGESRAAARSIEDKVYSVEFWLVQLQLPKGERAELAGTREEFLTALAALEKNSKAEVLNHVYLTAEEGKSAQAMLRETVSIVDSISGGLPGRRETDGGAAPVRPVSANISRESLGTQLKVLPYTLDEKSVLLDYTVTKTFLGKQEEGVLIPTDSAGGGIRRPVTRVYEVESAIKAPFEKVVTASTQMQGGEKPTELRVLLLVNPL